MAQQNFNIANFLTTLEANQPVSRDYKMKNENKIEKIYLSHPDWQGKYQVLPMVNPVTGSPITFLQKVREIKLPRTFVTSNKEEKEYLSWIKILPAEAYLMQSADGQIVSSLTSADEDLLRQVQSSFDILYDELGGNSKNRTSELNKQLSQLVRRRNYTLFYARCISHWGASDPRNPKHTNLSALFICSAKDFPKTISDSINDTTITNGDPALWMGQVYNREVTGRTGFLLFSVNLGVGGQIGYTLSAQHVINTQQVSNYIIPAEDVEEMSDPVEGFLGWQANNSDSGRLFNRKLMEETLSIINQKIAECRATKGLNPELAAQVTSNTAVQTANNAAINQAKTNDPMLQQAQMPGMTNPGAIMNGNNNPFQTPPAAQIDPITQMPINSQPSAPYTSPAFAQTGNNGLPF